jgi:hypothetical protein
MTLVNGDLKSRDRLQCETPSSFFIKHRHCPCSDWPAAWILPASSNTHPHLCATLPGALAILPHAPRGTAATLDD